ncbi:MAG: aminotransferase class I/II-fold pyridoxal phosphate-dependent enzyme [Planctomycetes bacterium]|nr:aminotransferase class I/II-fold pyridoxal phosphate-dependent enzyme [Planctomycetota bacterium]
MSFPYGTPGPHSAPHGPLSPPLVRATAHAVADASVVGQFSRGERHGEFYQRLGHSNGLVVESRVAELEGADGALAFASGMAAMSAAVLAHCAAGDRVLLARHIYGGTAALCRDDLPRFGIRVDRFDSLDLATLEEALRDPARLVVLETPINPTLRIVDLTAAAEICHRRGALLVVDGTFAPPPIQRALELGVDLLVHSATKFFGGHSDVLAGVVAGRHAVLREVAGFRTRTGGVLAPDVAWLLSRSLATLELRVSAQQAAAAAIARDLAEDPRLRVLHPSLTDHPDHQLATRQMRGGPTLVTFTVEGGLEAASRLFDRLRLVARAPSLGGVESVASLPCLTTHAGVDEAERAQAGIDPGMVRISVGLEGAAAIRDDVLQAL